MIFIPRLPDLLRFIILGAALFGASLTMGQTQPTQHLPPITFQRTAYSGMSIDELKQRVSQGDVAAELHLGLRFATGRDTEQNPKAAYAIFNKYAEKDPAARHNLGLLYEFGLGVEQDHDKAFELYKSAAEAGNIDAIYQLGHCYDLGIGVKTNLREALIQYRIAAKENHPDALNNLGVIYANEQKGYDGFPDNERALEYLQAAVKAGSVRAWANLGAMYFADEKFADAFEAYQQGAKLGDPIAARQAAVMIQLNKTQYKTQEDKDQHARQFYRIAVNFHDRYSLNRLGTMYWHGYGGDQDRIKAVSLWASAAKLGDAAAAVNLAFLYERGLVVEQNNQTALDWLDVAMKAKSARAYIKMGDAYSTGQLGLDADKEKARKHYEQAAVMNDETAMIKLALLLLSESRGDFRKDPSGAKRWFEAAAARNNARAMFELGHMFFTGRYVTRNISQALFHFEKAAVLKNAPSARAAGLIYLSGDGVQRNAQKAVAYLRMASDLGSAGASFDLGMVMEQGGAGQVNLKQSVFFFEKAIKQAEQARINSVKKRAEDGLARVKKKLAEDTP